MKILITGKNGFIASSLYEIFKKKNISLTYYIKLF